MISVVCLAVLLQPLYCFIRGHGFAQIDFEVAYHDVGVPFFIVVHLHYPLRPNSHSALHKKSLTERLMFLKEWLSSAAM